VTKYDAVFLKHFAQLIGGLMAFAVLLIFIAHHINNEFYGYNAIKSGADPSELNNLERERVERNIAESNARIGLPAGVYVGDAGREAMAAAQKAREEAAKAQVAYGGTLDGAVIYQNLCGACHGSGAGGAPQPTKEAWAPRIAQGVDTLYKHAIDGFQGQAGIMPPRGGNPSLTDEQVKASVDYMVQKYQ
jgi:cytochrome c5